MEGLVRETVNGRLWKIQGETASGHINLKGHGFEGQMAVDLYYLNEHFEPVATPEDLALVADRVRIVIDTWEREIRHTTSIRTDSSLIQSARAAFRHMDGLLDRLGHVQEELKKGTPTPSNEIISDIIHLVWEDKKCPSEEEIESWTDEQKQQAIDYCAAVHARAGDNDDVVVPPMPLFLGVKHAASEKAQHVPMCGAKLGPRDVVLVVPGATCPDCRKLL